MNFKLCILSITFSYTMSGLSHKQKLCPKNDPKTTEKTPKNDRKTSKETTKKRHKN